MRRRITFISDREVVIAGRNTATRRLESNHLNIGSVGLKGDKILVRCKLQLLLVICKFIETQELDVHYYNNCRRWTVVGDKGYFGTNTRTIFAFKRTRRRETRLILNNNIRSLRYLY